MDVFDIDNTYIAKTYARAPVCFVCGDGAELIDSEGKRYIDMGAGIAVNTFGAADKEWVDAVTAQAAQLQHVSNLYYTRPCAQLAEMLCQRTGMKKVFFSNSGAEANECAIKAARRFAFMKYGDESHATVITLKNSFHGRTLATLAATGQDSFHTEFGPFPGGFEYADPEDAGSVEAIASAVGCCAVMLEVVQGEGGVRVLSRQFIEAVKAAAAKHDLLIIVDEVQTGNGRTGKLYGYTNFELKPDIVSTAKGLGGGLPLGATMLGERLKDVFTPGSHGSTFGGNPVCCAGAISILSRITDEFLADVARKGDYLRAALTGATGVKDVSGLGLMLGITPVRPAAEILSDCRTRGLIVLTAKNKVRLVPPLCITDGQLTSAVEILREVLAK